MSEAENEAAELQRVVARAILDARDLDGDLIGWMPHFLTREAAAEAMARNVIAMLSARHPTQEQG